MTTGQPQPCTVEDYLYRRVGPVSLYLGDARQVLAAMPDNSVDCLVSSPPFWGLRDYGTGAWTGGALTCPHPLGRTPRVDGARCPRCAARWVDPQYGLEPTLEEYIGRLVAVFDQAHRILTPTGTCWLNLGDRYTTGTRHAHPTSGGITAGPHLPAERRTAPLAAKNLVGVPWRVAFALQATGKWILRNAIVWAKINPLPSSVADRFTTTYELLFLLVRQPRYHFDLDPVRIPLVRPEARDGSRVFGGARKGHTGGIDATARTRGGTYGPPAGKHHHDRAVQAAAARGNLRTDGHAHTAAHPHGRNPGDVWALPTRPYRGPHVAPYPVDIPWRAIAAGCPAGGTVCDPFSGAATTGLAALQLGRRFAGIDICAAFHDEALARLAPYLPDTPPAAGR